ncbi:MAG: hypothetical protein ACP5UQ_00160 [Anaerolineae bacterium]
MMMARVTLFCIFLAGASAAVLWASAGAWQVGLAAVALSALWSAKQQRRWAPLTSLMLLAFILLAAAGAALPSALIWAPLSLVAALAAWDLERFAGRLVAAEPSAETRDLERRHLLRLSAVCGLGLLLGWAGQAIHLKLDLAVVLLLGLLAIIGLNRLVRSLMRESD